MSLRRLGPLAVLAILSSANTGCYSKATAYEGKFTFGYAGGRQIENFVKPIAPGAKLDVVVFANGTDDKLSITKATSSKTSVVTVASVGRQAITLKGGEPGVSEIEITARDGAGNVLVDKMFFHVARPAKHAIEHACTEATEAVWVRDDDIFVFHSLAAADGRASLGYDYAPVTVEPAGALRLVSQPPGFDLYRYRAGSGAASATLRSSVDGKALTFKIVDRKDLREVTLLASDRLVEGRVEYAFAEAHYGGADVCSQRALTRARSLTPEVCRVSAKLDEEPEKDENREQLAVITALKFGECEYELTLPELDGGKGVALRKKVKIGRVQFPGEGGSEAAAGETAPAGGALAFGSACKPLGWDGRTWANAATWWVISRLVVLAGAVAWLRRRKPTAGQDSLS